MIIRNVLISMFAAIIMMIMYVCLPNCNNNFFDYIIFNYHILYDDK